jgi:hypothetical protein
MRVITQAAATMLILALAVFTVHKAVGPAPPQAAVGTKFGMPTPLAQASPNSDQGTSTSAVPPSSFMTPWPDLEDLTTSVSTADPVASGPAEPAHPPQQAVLQHSAGNYNRSHKRRIISVSDEESIRACVPTVNPFSILLGLPR